MTEMPPRPRRPGRCAVAVTCLDLEQTLLDRDRTGCTWSTPAGALLGCADRTVGLERFVCRGIDDATRDLIGRSPRATVCWACCSKPIPDQRPLETSGLGRSFPIPSPMRTFLGVPGHPARPGLRQPVPHRKSGAGVHRDDEILGAGAGRRGEHRHRQRQLYQAAHPPDRIGPPRHLHQAARRRGPSDGPRPDRRADRQMTGSAYGALLMPTTTPMTGCGHPHHPSRARRGRCAYRPERSRVAFKSNRYISGFSRLRGFQGGCAGAADAPEPDDAASGVLVSVTDGILYPKTRWRAGRVRRPVRVWPAPGPVAGRRRRQPARARRVLSDRDRIAATCTTTSSSGCSPSGCHCGAGRRHREQHPAHLPGARRLTGRGAGHPDSHLRSARRQHHPAAATAQSRRQMTAGSGTPRSARERSAVGGGRGLAERRSRGPPGGQQ